jgi:SAM-dependent methyltransferase
MGGIVSGRKLGTLRAGAALAGVLALASLAHAAGPSSCTAAYTPKRGQPGKDAMWLPTPQPLVERMLALARVGPADMVYDLGSGDGRIVISAAKLGAEAVGIEYNPQLVALSRCLIAAAGVASHARIVHGDLLHAKFSDATVVTLFLGPDLDVRLRPKLLALKPGTRVITPDGMAYLWIVPAHVDGSWIFRSRRGDRHFEVRFVQDYQTLQGLLGSGALLADVHLRGTHLAFSFPDGAHETHVTAVVEGARIEARVRRGGRTSLYVGTRP